MDKDFLVLDIREGSGRPGLLQQKDWLGAVLVFDIIILMEIRFLMIVLFLLGTCLLGVAFTFIVCEIHDIECRRRAPSIEPISFSMKLRFSLLWPYYLFIN